MGSSPAPNHDNNKDNTTHKIPSSPSKSSSFISSSSSPWPFSHFPPTSNPPPPSASKSMEEVWQDLNLASLPDQPSSTSTIAKNHNNLSFTGTILQDFLTRPFSKGPVAPSRVVASTDQASRAVFDSVEPPPAATMLSLNSGSDFQYLENGGTVAPLRTNPSASVVLHGNGSVGRLGFDSPFDALGPLRSFCKKRAQENGDNSGDPRHKRKIKNRESAARSRARKQAYTNELELEIKHLQEENAKLKRQQGKMLSAPAQLPKKRTLYRTSTAPF